MKARTQLKRTEWSDLCQVYHKILAVEWKVKVIRLWSMVSIKTTRLNGHDVQFQSLAMRPGHGLGLLARTLGRSKKQVGIDLTSEQVVRYSLQDLSGLAFESKPRWIIWNCVWDHKNHLKDARCWNIIHVGPLQQVDHNSWWSVLFLFILIFSGTALLPYQSNTCWSMERQMITWWALKG